MGQHAVWCIIAAVATIAIATAAPTSYYCGDALVQLSTKCNQSCVQTIGSALIGIYRGLSAATRPQLWHGLDPGYECDACSSSSKMHTLPAYCCWPGVYCCSEDPSSIVDQAGDPYGCTEDFPMGVHHLAMRGWNLSGSLTEEALDGLVQLTQHGLHSVDLSANALTGSIPRSMGRLHRLRTLNLNLNRLTGTLPVEMANMEQLEHFYASFNNLTGSVEDRFCIRNSSSLAILILRANNLSGTIDMTHCIGLELLDVQDNRFYGSLPVGLTNQKLISLRAANNMFNSNVPDALWQLPLLATVELANNDLTGTLSPYMGSVNNLVNIRLGNNSLSGTIPGNVTSNSQMLLLELYDNVGLHGTLPDVMNMVGIRVLDLHNTSISGTIPAMLGTFPYLEQVDIRSTRMLCCESQSQANKLAAQDINLLLPRFLQFNQVMVQYDVVRNIQESDMDADQPTDVMCGSVQRRLQPESDWNVLHLPVTNNAVGTQRWLIDPLYSFYKNCTCTPAYVTDPTAPLPVNITNAWCEDDRIPHNQTCVDVYIFRCVTPSPPALTPRQQAAIGIAATVCVALMIVTGNMCMARASKIRRYYMRARTRLQGTPTHGRMSLVVTDIEGYSDMFKRTPEVMYRALVIHNRVMNTAKYANCGFVLEQEGDSFTLAFYDAFDAVAFCLQVQQALNAVQWPEGLDGDELGFKSADSAGPSRKPSMLQQRLSRLLTPSSRRKVSARSGASSTVSEAEGPLGSVSIHHSPSQQLTQALASRLAGLSTGLGYRASVQGDPALFAGLKVRMGICTADVPNGTPIKSSALFQTAKVVSDFGNGGQIIMDHVTFAAVKDSLTVLGAVGANGINYQRLATHSPLQPAEEAVVLDMGAYQHTAVVAATADPDHHDLSCYPLSPTQQHPSNSSAAQPDGCCRSWSAMLAQLRSGRLSSSSSSAPCFDAAATLHTEVDTAERSGPPSRQNTGSAVRRGLSALFAGRMPSSTTDSSSLPSGRSMHHGSRVASHSFGGIRPSNSASTAGASATAAEHGHEVQRSQASFLGRVRSLKRSVSHAQHRGDLKRRNWSDIRLFQILPPPLTARAHVWHNQLNVKEGWQCCDMPYFDAPGSKAVPLSGGGAVHLLGSIEHGQAGCCFCNSFVSDPSSPSATAAAVRGAAAQGLRSPSMLSIAPGEAQALSGSGPPTTAVLSGLTPLLQPLPAVTMVFMAVENPEALVRRRRTFAPKVQALLTRVVLDALSRSGGYLCRMQEGDLRFMLAFGSAVTALEWCLVVQEAAMYLAWPTEPVLLYAGCTVERDEQQQMVFRGPRLKMGVCEGVPSSIFPDHEGRADYHGAVVNMAARFTDKAAKGGQIACTLELAQKVMAAWAAGSSNIGSSSKDTCLQDSAALAASSAAALAVSTWCSPTVSVDEEVVLGMVDEQRVSLELQLPGHQEQRQQQQQSPGAAIPPRPPALRVASGSQRHGWQVPWAKRATVLGSSPPTSLPSVTGSAAAAAASAGPSPLASPTSTSPSAPSSTCGFSPHEVQQLYSSVPSILHQPQQQVEQKQQHDSSWPGSPPSARVSSSAAPSRPHSFIQGSGVWQHQRQQQQQQQLGNHARLPPLQLPHQRISSASGDAAAPKVTSTFTASNVPRAPVQVEVHRLGLFAFKGGPLQQEMVQIVPKHLLGRLGITNHATVQPSRKGQLLQKLEGRVGGPVTVQLPVLAQEYKAALPERCFAAPAQSHASRVKPCNDTLAAGRQQGEDLLHASSRSRYGSSSSLPKTGSAPAGREAAAIAGGRSGSLQQQQQQRVACAGGSAATVAATAAARHSEGGAACAAAAAACDAPLLSLRVMSDTTTMSSGNWQCPLDAAGTGSNSASSGNATAPASASCHHADQTTCLRGTGDGAGPAAAVAASIDLGTCSKASSITVLDHISISLPTVDLEAAATTAAAAAVSMAAEEGAGSPGVHIISAGTLMRHDSFCSVVSGEADGGGDAAGDAVACTRVKSGSSGRAAAVGTLSGRFSFSNEGEEDVSERV